MNENELIDKCYELSKDVYNLIDLKKLYLLFKFNNIPYEILVNKVYSSLIDEYELYKSSISKGNSLHTSKVTNYQYNGTRLRIYYVNKERYSFGTSVSNVLFTTSKESGVIYLTINNTYFGNKSYK